MEKQKKILRAQSKKNGIIFCSNVFSFIGLETFFNSSGNIQCRLIPAYLDELMDSLGVYIEKEPTFNRKGLIIFNIALITLSIIAFIFSQNFGLVLAAIWFSIFVSFELYKFVKHSYEMKSKNGKERSLAKLHAAEHMAINAYHKLQRVPTLEEVKKFSRFTPKCGSRKTFSRIFATFMITIVIATLFSYNSLVYSIALVAITIFSVLAEHYGWLIFLQVFVTSKPTDKELKLAIEGLKQFEIMEEAFNNQGIIGAFLFSLSN